MTVLVLSPFFPYPPKFGGGVRVYHLMRQLAREHRLLLLCYHDGEAVRDRGDMDTLCERVEGIPHKPSSKRLLQARSLFSTRSFQELNHFSVPMQTAIDRVCAEENPDLILVEFAQMGCFRFPEGIPLVIDEHNVEYDLIRRMAGDGGGAMRRIFNVVEAAKFKRRELEWVGEAALTLVTSDRDGDLLKSEVPGLETALITNGVDCDDFAPPEEREIEPDSLVFVGATHYYPNEDGIHFFMREVYPRLAAQRPGLKVYLVGGRPPPAVAQYASANVEVTGFVDDVRPYMWSSSVFIVPLRMGGGTRFKVVEAMASGVPVVSTRLGAEGIPLEQGRHALLADRPEEFASAVTELLDDRGKAERLKEEGLRFVREHFDWSVIGDRLNRAVKRVVER
ncbi:glycosyltransferase [Kiritimatiella glycovorans]|uniref:Sugar transferase, PEP-CTERM/EpsH1 system associated n=1 Tax=Kiritimatiella glycovorans TaxID=1307763 RepID=A0A0G3EBR7_9BACT|nr:glycosyltransferase [Kiritimatiella glycovorans]AKJ63901.1 sugar transferase, PEP-CTERM/EpsH1 system associated [Kiritimatiella glycovorans]